MNKVKKVLGFILLSLVLVLGVYLGTNTTVSAAEHNDAIVKMYITDQNGNELTSPVIDQWQQFRINADFDLSGKDVKEGDVTIVTIPSAIQFVGRNTFELRDSKGNLVANGDVISGSKIKVTYTDYPEKHSDTKGNFFFYVRVDHTVIDTKQEIPLDISVGGRIVPAGNIQFQGIGEPSKDDIAKSGWQSDDDSTLGHFYIAINRSGKNMSDLKILDVLRNDKMTYLPNTFRVIKGQWVFRQGDWQIDNGENITNQSTIDINGSSFSIKLPDLLPTEGIAIYYDVRLPYTPVDGDEFLNDATLTGTNDIYTKVQSGYQYLAAGGQAEGYVVTIAVKKTNEEGESLGGVVFDVIRDRTGQSVGQITTDINGEGSIDNLLRDDYTLKEIKTPDGYEPIADIKVNPAEFDENTKIALKNIINKKKVTTTTTEAPTTTVITTEEPTTTVTTTATTEATTTSPATTVTTVSTTTSLATTVTTEATTTSPATTVTTVSTTTSPATTTTVVDPKATTTLPTPTTTTVDRPVLPRTGTANNPWLVVIGLGVLAAAGGFFYMWHKACPQQ